MGRDKATLVLDGETLAARLGRLLSVVARPALEVGPGRSGLGLADEDPGEGPLAALATGWHSLQARGFRGPVIVLATDLPSLTLELLSWLAARPESGSVVPVVAGRAQPLCARWAPGDLDRALGLVRAGERVVSTALGPDATYLPESSWAQVAPAAAFFDVDRPEDLGRHRLS